MAGLTGLEIVLGMLLAAIAVCILYLRLGCRKPRPGSKH